MKIKSWTKINIGSIWKPNDGSNSQITIVSVSKDSVRFFYENSLVYWEKDPFTFQVRYHCDRQSK